MVVRLGRATAILVVLVVFVALIAMPVVGHAYLVETDPGNGDRLETLPDEAVMAFAGDGVVVPDVSIRGPSGTDVSGEARVDADDPHRVIVPIVADDGEGMYLVEWQVLAEDGHSTQGTYFFSIGDEPLDRDAVITAIEDDAADPVSPAEVAANVAMLLGLAGLLGLSVAARLVLVPSAVNGSTAEIDPPLQRLAATFGVLLVTGVVGLGIVRVGAPTPDVLASFLARSLGQLWVGQLLVAIGLLGVLLAWLRGAIDRSQWLVGTLVGTGFVAAGVAWTSHSATLIGRDMGFVVGFGHLLGAAMWFGAVLTTAVIGLRLVRGRMVADLIRRTSVLAISGITLAGASGFIMAAWHVRSLDAGLGTVYGHALAVKIGFVVFAISIGGMIRFGLAPRLASTSPGPLGTIIGELIRTDGGSSTISRIRLLIRVELAAIVLVLVLSALMTSAPTAAVLADAGPTEPVQIERDDGVHVDVTIVPGEQVAGWPQVEEGQPLVIDVGFRADDQPVTSDRTVRLLAEHVATGTTTEIELASTDETGVYSGVHVLDRPGPWSLRITGEPAGEYRSEWIDVFATPAPDADHDHGGDTAGSVTRAVVLAILCGILGAVAAFREAGFLGRA